ncbi:MAG: hypothetical protein GY778_17190, partial [bacterium]|nr:hypothetical protein [bacterium]
LAADGLDRHNAAMDLAGIRVRDGDQPGESLTRAVQAVARWGGCDLDYCSLNAALGLSFMACSTGRDDDCVGTWMSYGRDVRLVEAAGAFGIRLRPVHPPEAALRLSDAAEFGQHFEASYRPIVLHALANRQPVLAWRGWPGERALAWGVITETVDDGLQLAGTTVGWADARVPLVSAPVQLYVVEDAELRRPGLAEVLGLAAESARLILGGATVSPWGIETGGRAYDRWIHRLSGQDDCPNPGHQSGDCHGRLIMAIRSARGAAADFFRECMATASPECQQVLEACITYCRGTIDALIAAGGGSAVARPLATAVGRESLVADVRAAQKSDLALATSVEELCGRLAQIT